MTDTSRHGFRGQLYPFSNFYRHAYFLPALGQTVLSSEHGFNALKTLNPAEQTHVLAAADPQEAKARGRKVTLRADWDDSYRYEAMELNLRAKFMSLPKLTRLLAEVDPALLVEYNTWHDQVWGDCICPRHDGTPGRNMLGETLRRLQTELLVEGTL